jgi:hypothetical protein
MEYSPLSVVNAERDNPVPTLVAVTVALATLPPETSVVFPDSVALTAWLRAEFGKIRKKAAGKTAKRIWSEQFHFLLITVHPQKIESPKPSAQLRIRYVALPLIFVASLRHWLKEKFPNRSGMRFLNLATGHPWVEIGSFE